MGVVYLRDIRSDGFALLFASLPGDEAEGGETICGILSGMILFSVSDDGGLGSQWVHYGSRIETIAPLRNPGILR